MAKQTYLDYLNSWVKTIDPRARVVPSDIRCGKRYGIVYKGAVLSEFMLKNEWHIYLAAINMCGEGNFKKKITNLVNHYEKLFNEYEQANKTNQLVTSN